MCKPLTEKLLLYHMSFLHILLAKKILITNYQFKICVALLFSKYSPFRLWGLVVYSSENMLLYPKLNNLFHFPVLKNFFFGIWVSENRKLKGYAILKTIQELDLTLISRYNFHILDSYFHKHEQEVLSLVSTMNSFLMHLSSITKTGKKVAYLSKHPR